MEILSTIFTTLLVQPLANGLAIFIKIFGGNLGLAIITFTIFLRLLLNPLTKPYMESMKKIRELNPQLDKIKKKYKGDKVKLAQAQADLYKQKGVNPSAGCIPYIIQIVILIAFFRMFTMTLSGDGAIEESFNQLLYSPLYFSPEATINTTFLGIDLTQPNTFTVAFLPFALPGIILILAALAQLVSSKIMAPAVQAEGEAAKKTKEIGDDMQATMQKSMVYTFPLFTIIFGMRFPAGLALYWMVISAFQAYQQYRTTGWGGMKPWLIRLGLLKSDNSKVSRKKQRGKKTNVKKSK